MEPMLSNLAATSARNTPRDLQARLYREIGISAVAAALKIYDMPAAGRSADKADAKPSRRAA